MAERKIAIMVVDDHPLLLAGLCMLLNAQSDMEVVAQSDNAGAVLALILDRQPDVLLLDITLQAASGLDLLPAIRQAAPEAQVIMLTMHEDQQYLQKALQQGAAGFVLKKGLDVDLLYAVRAVMRGEMFIQPSMMKEYIISRKNISPADGPPPDRNRILWSSLSQREREVMAEVARGRTSKEIAEKLFLSEKTVATYRSRAMCKLGLGTRADLVDFTLKIGVFEAKE